MFYFLLPQQQLIVADIEISFNILMIGLSVIDDCSNEFGSELFNIELRIKI